MACGKPVVGTKISGLDLIEKYGAGITVNSENKLEVSNAIIKLLKNSKLREKMGKNGQSLVLINFTWELNAKKVSSICNEFI
jgi:glycosyltransferase involved in cell wall biosynthesis